MSYKETLNLPKTNFSMKANLVQREPSILKAWDDQNIYHAIRKKKRKKKFVLHDGPPYANGHIHMGHVLNKILKDIVVKFYTMKGFDSPFVPGWDCHGLPVEHQLFKELGISKYDIDQVEFRKKSKDYALGFVHVQRDEFKRLGVFGDWENSYLTLDPKYEAGIVRSFGRLVKDGYIYRDLKPVNWCTTCETALAEAEVEYEEHKSPSIYVKFKVKEFANEEVKNWAEKNLFVQLPAHLNKRSRGSIYFVIWTTTPWTLLGNVAVALNPNEQYVWLFSPNGDVLIVADKLKSQFIKALKGNESDYEERRPKFDLAGKIFEHSTYEHPFCKRDGKVVLADYVSTEEGTGCVHTAPGHGQEDYITGKKYKLPIIMPVDEKGIFDNSCGEFSGLKVHEANKNILARMRKDGTLLMAEELAHSYPHCWRCKNPIIFRATEQYFVKIDHKGLRRKMLEVIKKDVKWYPGVGEARISSMIENRPDWCLSRQRYWGVPIVAFRCKKCREILLDDGIIEHVASIVEKQGCDAWFTKPEKDLLPEGTSCGKCGSRDLEKEKDIIDVWFESGVSHQSVLKHNKKLSFPCQLYLEGSDQHRGWFQSALITSCAIEKKAPYTSVLTHGFVVDGEGKKMSKSMGNVISPEEVMGKYGADILRLWVASSNYHDDVRLSEEILQRLADAYRKIRNTLRYLLGNIHDFDPKRHSVGKKDMLEIDRWMLSSLAGVIEEAEKNYLNYAFHKIFRSVYNFCVYEISSLYLDILKDRLYTYGQDSTERRSCQTVLYETLTALLKITAPILSFTAEEAYAALGSGDESVHATLWEWGERQLAEWKDEKLNEKWAHLLEVREEVLKALEEKRSSNKIGSPLEAKVILYSDKDKTRKLLMENAGLLPMFFITSQVEVNDGQPKDAVKARNLPLWVAIERADGAKCNRCWNYRETVGADKEFTDICSRCRDVIHKSHV